MDALTVNHVILVLVILQVVMQALRIMAPKTETKIDDAMVDTIDRAKEWAAGVAPLMWCVVEAAAKQGGLPKMQKAAEFLTAVQRAYLEQHGKQLPGEAESVAKTIAAGMSARDKLSKLPDPQSAPGSK